MDTGYINVLSDILGILSLVLGTDNSLTFFKKWTLLALKIECMTNLRSPNRPQFSMMIVFLFLCEPKSKQSNENIKFQEFFPSKDKQMLKNEKSLNRNKERQVEWFHVPM